MSYRDTQEGMAKRLLGDARYAERHRFPKWNITPTVLQEPRLFPRIFPELTKADHLRLADKFEDKAKRVSNAHHRALERGRKAWGTHGSLISGGFREHWGESSKEMIRRLAHGAQLFTDASRAHRAAAKLRNVRGDASRSATRPKAHRRVPSAGQNRFYLTESRHGWSAVLLDRQGRSVNVINGDRGVSRARVLSSARANWDEAKEIAKPTSRDPASRSSTRRHKTPTGYPTFIVKISGVPRYNGEYTGGKTLAEAIVEARTFKERVGRNATIRVVYFTFAKGDPPDGRLHVARVVQQGT